MLTKFTKTKATFITIAAFLIVLFSMGFLSQDIKAGEVTPLPGCQYTGNPDQTCVFLYNGQPWGADGCVNTSSTTTCGAILPEVSIED